jgi:endonuclease III related protein
MYSLLIKQILLDIYRKLLALHGSQHWWPAENPFEVMVGAILTQSTAWANVENGISNLKKAAVLSPQALRQIEETELAGLIHSCGYFNAKARKLKAYIDWFGRRFQDNLDTMCSVELRELRTELLGVFGIGEETADSILLYACRKPVFVIDAYTRRIVDRLGMQPGGIQYRDYQALFTDNLPRDEQLYNEYHALLVAHGKETCRKHNPQCEECCLKQICKGKANGLIYKKALRSQDVRQPGSVQ